MAATEKQKRSLPAHAVLHAFATQFSVKSRFNARPKGAKRQDLAHTASQRFPSLLGQQGL